MSPAVLGLDEAGRGPMFGPMVLCGVAGDPDELRSMGVRDSKMLRPARREELSKAIKERCEWRVSVVTPSEIDTFVDRGGLNELEAIHFARLIGEFGHRSAVVDCADVDEARFASTISNLSGCPNVVAEHKADVTYPSVSAASIIAKSTRDALVAEIQADMGVEIGSGYPSDRVSIGFLTSYMELHSALPAFVRQSWQPVKRIMAISKIKNLDDFRSTDDRGAH